MVKATWFMRQPFFVKGYQVDKDNMAAIAKWCEGHIIEDAEEPFIRVPVDRPTHKMQTEARIGTWVLLSVRKGAKSFKVYPTELLLKSFYKIDNMIPSEYEIPDEPEGDSEEDNEDSPEFYLRGEIRPPVFSDAELYTPPGTVRKPRSNPPNTGYENRKSA